MSELIENSYFMDKHKLSKIKSKEEKKVKKTYRKELKFYKKRLYGLIKEVLDGNEKNEELVSSLEVFLKKGIEYLKNKDRTSIIQEEYNNIGKKVSFKRIMRENETERKMGECNNLLFRELEPKCCNIEESMGLKRIKTKEDEKEIIPLQKEINLKDPKFKKKK